MKGIGKELFTVYRSLSAQRQSEMINDFQRLHDNEADEALKNFYSKLIELLEKEKKENV